MMMNSRRCSSSVPHSTSSRPSTDSYVYNNNDDTVANRVEFLKKRFAGLIDKSQKTLRANQRVATSHAVKKAENCNVNKKKGFGKQSSCKKQRIISSEDDDVAVADDRKLQILKMREAARKEIEEMRNDTGICDPQEVMREFAKLIRHDD